MNASGAIVGVSNLKGDLTYHPFLWTKAKLKDLGTLGGDDGFPSMINDGGEIVGLANNKQPCTNCEFSGLGLAGNATSQQYHGAIWRKGKITDLGAPAGQPCQLRQRAQLVRGSGRRRRALRRV